mmetsp:Transcript_37701/g.83967  ORF Transcript_37701/g.83967 Transcript_37701/m.83967 type:complete len:89 (+) Transcript_37701:196-462(+)
MEVILREEYPEVSVNFVHGQNPVFIVYDQWEEEMERIAVSQYSFDRLDELVRSYGFRRKDDVGGVTEESSEVSVDDPTPHTETDHTEL